MRLAFLGPPGAGKGTQARALAREWGVAHLATGDMLREALAAGTRLGLEAKRYMDRGALVPDDVIIGLMRERLAGPDVAQGFHVEPADGPVALLLRRLTGRCICRRCQTVYHLVSAPPRTPGVCDRCGGELYRREDDDEATVRTRLEVYARQTAPLLAYYRQRGLLATVAGEGSIEAIRGAIRAAVGAER